MFAAKDRPPQDAASPSHPGTFASPARFLPTSDCSSLNCGCPQAPRRRRVSSLRTLLPAQNFQPTQFQSLPHSLQQEKNTTPAFPVTSELFLRSFAQERKSTPLFSCACAQFRRYVGGSERNSEIQAKVTTRRGVAIPSAAEGSLSVPEQRKVSASMRVASPGYTPPIGRLAFPGDAPASDERAATNVCSRQSKKIHMGSAKESCDWTRGK
jgi:hypothetical protein